jgi:hypothetical protein
VWFAILVPLWQPLCQPGAAAVLNCYYVVAYVMWTWWHSRVFPENGVG